MYRSRCITDISLGQTIQIPKSHKGSRQRQVSTENNRQQNPFGPFPFYLPPNSQRLESLKRRRPRIKKTF